MARHQRKLGALVLGGVASLATFATLSSGSLGAFVASITNSANTAGAGTLNLVETSGAYTCNSFDSTSTCSTINKYGGNLAMSPNGAASVTKITMKNTGTAAATSFVLKPGTCSTTVTATGTASATDLCGMVKVTITDTAGTKIFDGTAASLYATYGASGWTFPAASAPLAAGSSMDYTFTVAIDPTADNTYEGLQIAQQLVWTLNA